MPVFDFFTDVFICLIGYLFGLYSARSAKTSTLSERKENTTENTTEDTTKELDSEESQKEIDFNYCADCFFVEKKAGEFYCRCNENKTPLIRSKITGEILELSRKCMIMRSSLDAVCKYFKPRSQGQTNNKCGCGRINTIKF